MFARYAIQAGLDVLAFGLAIGLAYVIALQQGKVPFPERLPNLQLTRLRVYSGLVLTWIVWFGWIRQAYSRPKPYWDELQTVLKGVLVLAVVDLALLAISKQQFSRTWWAIAWLMLPLLLLTSRRVARASLNRVGLWRQTTLIFGDSENAIQAYMALRSEPAMGFEVLGFVATDPTHPVDMPDGLPRLAWRPETTAWPALRDTHCVIAVESHQHELRDTLIRQLSRQHVRNVHVIPAMRGVPLYGLESSNFFSHEVLLIHLRNSLANPRHRALKRTFDLLSSIALLVLLSPLFAILAYMVSRDGGSPFFAHNRVGQNGRPFGCLKFRSMIVNAEQVLQQVLASDAEARCEWERDFKLRML
jgi:FlaA1/EpsC-like NDP-sugar epimerase